MLLTAALRRSHPQPRSSGATTSKTPGAGPRRGRTCRLGGGGLQLSHFHHGNLELPVQPRVFLLKLSHLGHGIVPLLRATRTLS